MAGRRPRPGAGRICQLLTIGFLLKLYQIFVSRPHLGVHVAEAVLPELVEHALGLELADEPGLDIGVLQVQHGPGRLLPHPHCLMPRIWRIEDERKLQDQWVRISAW